MNFKNLFLLLFLLVLSSSCDTGLTPLNEPSGFRGVIRFKNWPSPDSIRDIGLVAFESFPTDSAGILATLLEGRASISPKPDTRKLPLFVDSLTYEFTTENALNLQTKNYEYIILAMRYGPNILTDWRPAGVYTLNPNTFAPEPLRVLLHRITPNVDINVDFHNLPPKPWR